MKKREGKSENGVGKGNVTFQWLTSKSGGPPGSSMSNVCIHACVRAYVVEERLVVGT